jgi:hypothetical protein
VYPAAALCSPLMLGGDHRAENMPASAPRAKQFLVVGQFEKIAY